MPRRPAVFARPAMALVRLLPALGLLLAIAAAQVGAAESAGAASDQVVLRSSPATVTISNLSQAFDGEPRPVSVTTSPTGLSYLVTYNNSTTVPSAVGSYTVVATVTQANYTGSNTATLTIYAGSATTTTTASTTSATTTTSGTTTAVDTNSGSSSSPFPCGLGSGTALVVGLTLWGRRRGQKS